MIPGPKIVPSCAQITFVWNLESGKTGHQVLYGRYTGAFAGTAAQATSIHTGLSTGAAWTALATTLATTTQLAAVTIRDVNSANNPIFQSTSAAVPGTSASAAMPNEVAAVVTLRTAFTGPSFRGRSYLPGFAQGIGAAGNVIQATAVTAIQNWANTWSGIFTGQGYQLVLGQPARAAYTGSTGRAHPARAATSTPITGTVVRDNHWDTQRRRGLK